MSQHLLDSRESHTKAAGHATDGRRNRMGALKYDGCAMQASSLTSVLATGAVTVNLRRE
jgi:hypothetical protein